jgi:hypothetical protein
MFPPEATPASRDDDRTSVKTQLTHLKTPLVSSGQAVVQLNLGIDLALRNQGSIAVEAEQNVLAAITLTRILLFLSNAVVRLKPTMPTLKAAESLCA